MAKILKTVGKALLYIVAFPFILIVIALAAVLSIFLFFYQFVRLIILFFSGRTLFSDLDEDIKAKEILAKQSGEEETNEPINNDLSLYPSDSIVYNNQQYSSPLVEEQEQKDAIKENNEQEEGEENV